MGNSLNKDQTNRGKTDFLLKKSSLTHHFGWDTSTSWFLLYRSSTWIIKNSQHHFPQEKYFLIDFIILVDTDRVKNRKTGAKAI